MLYKTASPARLPEAAAFARGPDRLLKVFDSKGFTGAIRQRGLGTLSQDILARLPQEDGRTSEADQPAKDKQTMKKILITMACVLALGLGAAPASALSIGDTNYLGSVDPSSPANPPSEAEYINFLISMPAPSSTTDDGRDYVRSSNSCATFDGCPAATPVGADTNNDPLASVDVTGWTWLLAKYGTESHVWYVGDLAGLVSVPLNAPGGGQSHYSLFNPTTTVPDGGATAGLLGLAMLGVAYLRRRIA
jgi:hypothetical protein